MDVFSCIEIGLWVFQGFALCGLVIWLQTLEARDREREDNDELREVFVEGWLDAHSDRLNRLEAIVLRGADPERETTSGTTPHGKGRA